MFKFPTLIILVYAMLGFHPIFSDLADAQTPAPIQQQVHLGCSLSWGEPMVPDPGDSTKMVSSWTDLKGFAHLARKDQMQVWDPMLEIRKDDPTLRELSCADFQVDALGVYSAGIRTYDTSMNMGPEAWLTFEVVEQDVTPPDGVINFCLKGTLNGLPFELGCLKP